MSRCRLFAFSLVLSLLCNQVSAQSKDTPKTLTHLVFAPYWTAESGWHSMFLLRNNLSNTPLTVTPLVRLANGQEVRLAPVTISGGDVVNIDVGDQLQQASPPIPIWAGTYGSVVFKFDGFSHRNLYAAVMVHAEGKPIGYHIDAFGSDEQDYVWAREGIWWLPRPNVKDNLVIANASDKPNHGLLTIYDASGKSWHKDLQLAPRQTLRLSIGELVRSAGLTGIYGGFTFQIAERSAAIDTTHFVYDETVGFSALMKMFDHDPASPVSERLFGGNTIWTTWAPMLALQNPDPALALPKDTQLKPQILLRNTTSKPQIANVKLTWRGDSDKGILTLPPIQLKPQETRLIDVALLQQKSKIPLDAHWALIEISSPTAKPDDIMAIASSYDSTGRYGAQTPFSDQLADHWVAGEFQVDATHNSLIAISNVGKKAAHTQITFHYNHGQSHYEMLKTIAPGDQLWLNMADIIRGAVADKNGATFPNDLTSGAYDIRQLHAVSKPSIFEGKIIVDKSNGHLAYGCVDCCGYIGLSFVPDPYSDIVGRGTADTVLAQDACDLGQDDVTSETFNWASSNAAVASVVYARTSLNSAGTATGSAQAQLLWGSGRRNCPAPIKTARQSITSQPTISGPTTVWWFNGQSISGYPSQITLNTQASGTWNVVAGSSEVSLSPTTGQSTTVSGTGTYSQTANDVHITVTVNGVTSPQFVLSSSGPKFLTFNVIDSDCSDPGYQGWESDYLYTLRDNFNNAMGTVPVNEDFVGSTVWPKPTSQGGTTDGTGHFTDRIKVCATPGGLKPMPQTHGLGSTLVDSFHQDWCAGSQASIPWGSFCIGKSVQSDTVNRYLDHGRVTVP